MPQKELERQQAVQRFLKLELSKEKELQEIVQLAAKICGTPSALITLIDQDTQYIKVKQAFDNHSSLREDAFCNHVIAQDHDQVMVVPDAKLDWRFQDNPAVLKQPGIRFYAGAVLTTLDGHNLGTLCVVDQVPGTLSDIQQDMLKALAKQVIQLMEFDESLAVLKHQYHESKRSEIELRAFFESSKDQHTLLGKDFEILNFNKTCEMFALYTYGYQMKKGGHMVDYIPAEFLDEYYRDYLIALNGTPVYDERSLPREGQEYWWIFKFEPAYNAAAEIIGVSVNVTDVNNRVEHEKRIKVQSKQLEEIAFIQSHEFRKPVASILGLMQLINMDGRTQDMDEWMMMERAVEELDNKIRAIVGRIPH